MKKTRSRGAASRAPYFAALPVYFPVLFIPN
jgi:hypothetical protein